MRRLRPLLPILLAFAAPACAGDANGYHVPRTAFGAPDLQGLWTNLSLTVLERRVGAPLTFATHAEEDAYEQRVRQSWDKWVNAGLGQGASEWQPAVRMARIDGRLRTSWLVDPADGRLPWRSDALKRFEALDAAAEAGLPPDPEALPATDRCLIGGLGSDTPPMMNPAVAGGKQIVQTRSEVAILSEMNHDVRIVRMGARHLPQNVRAWMGDSIGWWEGDTLVVETTNFHPEEGFRLTYALSPDARVVERFTRVSPTELRYAFEVDDPANYTQVWRGEMPFVRDKGPINEFACHEGNYAVADILAAARRADALKADLQPVR
jgi:hypothetical protein